MRVFRGFQHSGLAPACALTIGNFDGVHRGHQAMLALLRSEARHRGVPTCVLTFEPHPRDHFARMARKPELAPARIATLRDKLEELSRCAVDQCIVLPFGPAIAGMAADVFIEKVLLTGLGARYVLVGDDFRFGARRAGDYALLDSTGSRLGFDVARMMSYEVHGLRVSSSAVREALSQGRMQDAARLLGRPYAISGHVVHGRKLGREFGFPTLNLRFRHWKPAASGIFTVTVHGLGQAPLAGVANLGVRPSLDPEDVNGGRVLLETHCLDWPSGLVESRAYGAVVRVDLHHKLHAELRYPDMDALKHGIAEDVRSARAWFAANPKLLEGRS